MKKVIYISMFLFLFSCGGNAGESKKSEEPKSEEEILVPQNQETNWQYWEDEDEMDNTKRYYAYTVSTNKLEFDFPYSGGSELQLTLRKTKKGTDVMLMIDKGQFLGSFLGEEQIRVKFDSNEPVNFTYSSTDSGSGEVIFINNEQKFITLLKTAQKVKMEPKFFETGAKVVDFDVQGLEWN